MMARGVQAWAGMLKGNPGLAAALTVGVTAGLALDTVRCRMCGAGAWLVDDGLVTCDVCADGITLAELFASIFDELPAGIAR